MLVLNSPVDPTKTSSVVRRFEADLARRWRRVAAAIKHEVIEEDGFGYERREFAWNARRFDFPRSDQKVAAFMKWLRKLQDDEVLEIRTGVAQEYAAKSSWANLYIKTAYQKGIARSAAQMRKGGLSVTDRWVEAAFFRPVHADRIGLVYTRVFSELEGVTKVMDTRISRVLSLGMMEGRGVKDIARDLNETVKEIGLTRSRVIARTEIIRSHAEATLNTYEEAGLSEVTVEAEFATAQDNRVCPKCEKLASEGPYNLKEARGMIPVHPNCRCAWIPVVNNPGGVEFR